MPLLPCPFNSLAMSFPRSKNRLKLKVGSKYEETFVVLILSLTNASLKILSFAATSKIPWILASVLWNMNANVRIFIIASSFFVEVIANNINCCGKKFSFRDKMVLSRKNDGMLNNYNYFFVVTFIEQNLSLSIQHKSRWRSTSGKS